MECLVSEDKKPLNWKPYLLAVALAGGAFFFGKAQNDKPEKPAEALKAPVVADVLIEPSSCPEPKPCPQCAVCKPQRVCPEPRESIIVRGNCDVDWEKGTVRFEIPQGKQADKFLGICLKASVSRPKADLL